MAFRDEMRKRGWLAGKQTQAVTHFLMDGGKLSVPNEHAGHLLNLIYIHAILKKESLSIVELKTPNFKLFFDLDAKFKKGTPKKQMLEMLERISTAIRKYLVGFFDTTVDTTGIMCVAPTKVDNDGDTKAGVHLIFPNALVNSQIASICRDGLLTHMEESFMASTSADIRPMNSWPDLIDDSVFRANGLRMVWNNKGKTEKRQYVPYAKLTETGTVLYTFNDITEKRDAIRDTSIRVFDAVLSPCAHGEHTISIKEDAKPDVIVGTSASIDMYGSVLPDIRSVLPAVYKDVIFTAAFVTSYAVMLKTTSRFCQNKGDEHRTSTVYFCVTRQGICQRCYCRKDTNTCDKYASHIIPLPERVLRVFFPDFLPDDDDRSKMRKPVKRRLTNLDSVLRRTKLLKNAKK
jgi:hypothetical protein